MDRVQLSQVVYALFGLSLLASNAVSLQTSVAALPLVAAVLSAGIVVVAVVGIVRPDATVAGLPVAIGERPRWVLALLGIATAVLFAGVAISL